MFTTIDGRPGGFIWYLPPSTPFTLTYTDWPTGYLTTRAFELRITGEEPIDCTVDEDTHTVVAVGVSPASSSSYVAGLWDVDMTSSVIAVTATLIIDSEARGSTTSLGVPVTVASTTASVTVNALLGPAELALAGAVVVYDPDSPSYLGTLVPSDGTVIAIYTATFLAIHTGNGINDLDTLAAAMPESVIPIYDAIGSVPTNPLTVDLAGDGFSLLDFGTVYSEFAEIGLDITAGINSFDGTSGLIIYSPNSTAYRVTVTDLGTLTVTAV